MTADSRFTLQNCPYLGLRDDQRTSLAYPSAWNYCYRGSPPAPVSISHQVAACLNAAYMECPVYLAKQVGSFPVNLRGRSNTMTQRRRTARRKTGRMAWSAFLFLFLILSIIAVREFLPGYIPARFFSILGLPLQNTPSMNINEIPGGTAIPSTTPLFTQGSTQDAPQIPTIGQEIPTLITSKTPLPRRCGYTLDTPFGSERKFSLHQIASGENLDKLAETHQTTVDAIRAVNFSMPLPVWENWIVVIPVGFVEVAGLPEFEPYQADGTIFSLTDLALQLGVDVQSLAVYNAFTDECTVFRGWLIVPHRSEASSN